MSEWIDVKERLPEMDVEVIVCQYNGHVTVSRRSDTYYGRQWNWMCCLASTKPSDMVHFWQPLPSPPPRTLTKDEALREAIHVISMCAENGPVLFSEAAQLLPKLREALT